MSRIDDSNAPLPRLAPRRPHSHKGDYGRLLLVGGSQGMAGAIALAGMAALRSGAGLVKLAVPRVCQSTVAGCEPACMTAGLPDDCAGLIAGDALPIIVELADRADVVACGPGLGRSPELDDLVAALYRTLPQPLVIDADGLNALAARPETLTDAGGPRLLTPHPGEFGRLIGRSTYAPEEREELARDLAARSAAVVVLKGHRTLITDGTRFAVNTTGNPGMATGGTGDVLTGIIAAVLGQGLPPFEAAWLSAHVHGLAGDLAAEELGQVGLVASDLLRFLPPAWKACG